MIVVKRVWLRTLAEADECYKDVSPVFGFANNDGFWRHSSLFDARVSASVKRVQSKLNPVDPVTALQWKHERRLVLVASPTWMGWFCERCYWHITLDTVPAEGQHSLEIQAQFDAHDCEEFARQNWTSEVESPVEGR